MVEFSVACGNGLRYVLSLSISFLAHEWYIRAYDCQIMLDAIGDSTNGANCTARTSQPLHRTIRPQNIYDSVHHLSAK